jgi:hypothetical protein
VIGCGLDEQEIFLLVVDFVLPAVDRTEAASLRSISCWASFSATSLRPTVVSTMRAFVIEESLRIKLRL